MIINPTFSNIQDLPDQQASSLYTDQLQQHILPEELSPSGELNWGRLICTWHEKKEDHQIITHTYAACIDGKDGGIYLDCRPRKIFAKCLVHLFTRPIFTIIKTAYHLSLYPIFNEIVKSYHSNLPKQEKFKNLVKASADILLTPLYGVALTVCTLAVLIVGTFNPQNLYEGRKILGKIEQASNWGQIHTFWTLAKCFQPTPLENLNYYGQRDFSHDTVYQDQTDNSLDRQLTNFARAHIVHKRKVFDLFACKKLSPDTLYQSPILEF